MLIIEKLKESINSVGELPKDLLGVITDNRKDLMGIKPEVFIKFIRDNTKLKHKDDVLLKAYKKYLGDK